MNKLKENNISGYLIHVLDPVEISFHIGDNVEMNDLETGKSFLLGDSNFIKEKYKENLHKLISELKFISKENSWNYLSYNTEKKLNKFLLYLTNNISLKKNKIA